MPEPTATPTVIAAVFAALLAGLPLAGCEPDGGLAAAQATDCGGVAHSTHRCDGTSGSAAAKVCHGGEWIIAELCDPDEICELDAQGVALCVQPAPGAAAFSMDSDHAHLDPVFDRP